MHHETSGVRARIDRALRTMEGQHEHLLEFHQELDQSLRRRDTAAAREWIARLLQALTAHFELEETVVFPTLSELDPSTNDAAGRLRTEHIAVASTLEGLLEASLDALERALPGLRQTLSTHESDEERMVRRALGPRDDRA